jgi:hypothetical protein
VTPDEGVDEDAEVDPAGVVYGNSVRRSLQFAVELVNASETTTGSGGGFGRVTS